MDANTKKKIIDHYQKGQGSIQDIARVYKFTVDEVLEVLGLGDLSAIPTTGDLIDQNEAGPEVVVNAQGKIAKANFTTN